MDKEFLQYINEMEYYDLLDFNEETITKYKNTFHYQMWRLGKAYKEFADAMRKDKLGFIIISIFEKIF